MAALEPAVVMDQDEKFLDGLGELEWIDDVTEYECTRCQKVLVQHYISNCEHKFCNNCKRVVDDGSQQWRCPRCKEFIEEIGRQNVEFGARVRDLRLHCPNRNYGCQHICSFEQLKEHLEGCENTRENILPVLLEEEPMPDMLVEVRQLRRETNEMKRVLEEMEEKQKEGRKELREQLVSIIKDRVDGIKSDQRETLKEISKEHEKKWAETNVRAEELRKKVKKRKAEVENVKTKTDKKITKINKILDEKASKAEVDKIKKRYSSGINWKMLGLILAIIAITIPLLGIWFEEKLSECATNIKKLEERMEDNKLLLIQSINEDFEQKVFALQQKMFTLEQKIITIGTNNQIQKPEMNEFILSDDNHNFQPDFTWTINGIGEKLKQETLEINSEMFQWIGYPGVQAEAKMELKEDEMVSLFLRLKKKSPGKATSVKLTPSVYYILRDQSESSYIKHWCRHVNYMPVFRSKFNYGLTFERDLTHKSWLTNSVYNEDDSIVIDIYVEPPSVAHSVHSYDGTLDCTIDNFSKRKMMAKEGFVQFYESPYFYTDPKGYRVRVMMVLEGWKEYKGIGLVAGVNFLEGEFDNELPKTFAHETIVTLFNPKDPQFNVTETVHKDIRSERHYVMDLCSDEELKNLIENNTLHYKVTIKPSN